MDGYGSHVIQVIVAGDVEDVVLLEYDIADSSIHDVLDVNRKDRACQVFVFPLQHGTIGESITGESVGSNDELLHGVDGSQLIGAGTIDGTFDLDSVGIALQDGFNLDSIAIHGGEGAELVLANGADLVLVAVLSLDADAARISLVAETTCISEEVFHRFAVLHLVAHRALDGTREFDELLVCRNNDDIAFFEGDIALGTTVHDKVIDVEDSHIATSAIEHDLAKRTNVADTTCTVEGMENRGEGTQGIGARILHLAHDMHLDGARLTEREFHVIHTICLVEAGIDARKLTTQVSLGFRNGLARKVHQTKTLDADGSIGRDFFTNGGSIVAPDVNNDLVACTKHVVLGCGKVHRRLEGEFLRIEDVAAKDGEFLLLNGQHHLVFAPKGFCELIAGLALEFFGRGESVTGVAAGVYKSAVVSCSTSDAGGGRGPAGCSATTHAVLST